MSASSSLRPSAAERRAFCGVRVTCRANGSALRRIRPRGLCREAERKRADYDPRKPQRHGHGPAQPITRRRPSATPERSSLHRIGFGSGPRQREKPDSLTRASR